MAPTVRKRQLNVLLSEDEFGRLEHLADERGLTASDAIRLLIRREFDVCGYLTPTERDAALGVAHHQAMHRARENEHTGKKAPRPKRNNEK